MTNYANWFAYYRTRLTAVKTVTSLAFLGKTAGTLNLDDQYRIGFHTMFSYGTSFVDIADFDATQKTAWAKQLMDLKIPLGQETPTLNTISRIGDYYLNGTSALLPGLDRPDRPVVPEELAYVLHRWVHQPELAAHDDRRRQDDTVGRAAAHRWHGRSDYRPHSGRCVAATVPRGHERKPASRNSASDYVTNYWVTNLRPASPNDVATNVARPGDRWPHLNFAAMSLGTEGILPSGNQSEREAQLTAGTLQWPKPQPTVYKPDHSGVDDLWHAAINGRGRFVNAQSADELKLGMGQILQDVVNQAGARGRGIFQSSSISRDEQFHLSHVVPAGLGCETLRKIQIDPVTRRGDRRRHGTHRYSSGRSSPSFRESRTRRGSPIVLSRRSSESGKPVPFLDSTCRRPATSSIRWRRAKPPAASAMLEFLRGNRSPRETRSASSADACGGLLGDIVDSQPVYVGPPTGYLEAMIRVIP